MNAKLESDKLFEKAVKSIVKRGYCEATARATVALKMEQAAREGRKRRTGLVVEPNLWQRIGLFFDG